MTQELLGDQNTSSVDNSVDISPEIHDSSESTKVNKSFHNDGMVSKQRVDEIAKDVYARAFEKGKQEAYKNQSNQKESYSSNNVSIEELRRVAAEEARKQHEELQKRNEEAYTNQMGKDILNQLMSKFEAGKNKYEDFDQKVAPYFNVMTAPIFGMANNLDNTADVSYELASRPHLIDEINSTLKYAGPSVAFQKLTALSESLKLNQQASTVRTPNDPLSQIKSSPISGDDGSMSVTEARKRLLKRGL